MEFKGVLFWEAPNGWLAGLDRLAGLGWLLCRKAGKKPSRAGRQAG